MLSSKFQLSWPNGMVPEKIFGCFVPCDDEISPVVLGKMLKMLKGYGQIDGPTDDRQKVIREPHLSFQLG